MPLLQRVDQALAWARAYSDPLDVQVLLMHVLGVDRATLIAHPEYPLDEQQTENYRTLIERLAAGVPLPYLTGKQAFYGREFTVTPAVLIPRPETEHLIDTALDWARGRRNLRVVDVGTGSGIIAVILAAHLPDAAVWAIDLSAEALAIARQNAARYDLENRITFVQGDLLEPILGMPVDLIAANLPYIASPEVETLPVARYEPLLALDGGADGLALIRRLVKQAATVLVPGGLLVLETAAGQGPQVCALAADIMPETQVRLMHDYAGLDRVVSIESLTRPITRALTRND
jgi:release factor glutamine methyltransferase